MDLVMVVRWACTAFIAAMGAFLVSANAEHADAMPEKRVVYAWVCAFYGLTTGLCLGFFWGGSGF